MIGLAGGITGLVIEGYQEPKVIIGDREITTSDQESFT